MSAAPYDYVVVGAGLFGSTWAREATDAGKRCLVIDRRPHVGGNVFTEAVEGVTVHRYGPHIFHTSNERIWDYVRRFATFNRFVNRPRVSFRGRMYSFPINLMTLHQVWGVVTPDEARARLDAVRIPCEDPSNLEDWMLSQVGRELYEIFIEGYTRKQWRREPRDLPASIVKRLPIRLTYDDGYYDDRFQGIPEGGYTGLVERMLAGIEVRTNVDYFADRSHWDAQAHTVVFTGCIDEYFGFSEGRLEYRTLDFETKVLDGDFQGVAVVNHTAAEVPYTRTVEHKHFELGTQPRTVVTWEYPGEWAPGKVPYYPIGDARNAALYQRYRERAEAEPRAVFGGRLAEYRYYDMHQVIGSALTKVRRHLRAHGDAQTPEP